MSQNNRNASTIGEFDFYDLFVSLTFFKINLQK